MPDLRELGSFRLDDGEEVGFAIFSSVTPARKIQYWRIERVCEMEKSINEHLGKDVNEQSTIFLDVIFLYFYFFSFFFAPLLPFVFAPLISSLLLRMAFICSMRRLPGRWIFLERRFESFFFSFFFFSFFFPFFFPPASNGVVVWLAIPL
jgi:hypothetical protein